MITVFSMLNWHVQLGIHAIATAWNDE